MKNRTEALSKVKVALKGKDVVLKLDYVTDEISLITYKEEKLDIPLNMDNAGPLFDLFISKYGARLKIVNLGVGMIMGSRAGVDKYIKKLGLSNEIKSCDELMNMM